MRKRTHRFREGRPRQYPQHTSEEQRRKGEASGEGRVVPTHPPRFVTNRQLWRSVGENHPRDLELRSPWKKLGEASGSESDVLFRGAAFERQTEPRCRLSFGKCRMSTRRRLPHTLTRSPRHPSTHLFSLRSSKAAYLSIMVLCNCQQRLPVDVQLRVCSLR